MKDRFVTAIGAYLPLLRLDRSAAAKALRFTGLGGRGAGHRAVASWDEDALTLAVEAARALPQPDRLVFASTSAPFFDRSHAALAIAALGFADNVRSGDVAGSRRCAVAAALDALLSSETAIVAAGEKRPTRPGNAAQLRYGDGGAAIAIGCGGGARLLGHASRSHDLIDSVSSREAPEPYAYEERFVRETAARHVIAPAIRDACEAAKIEPARIAHAAVHEPLPGLWNEIAKIVGVSAPNHATTLETKAGDLGAAHALLALALAFNAAKPGEIVLLAGFGSGCDALLFEMTGPVAGASEAAAVLNSGQVLSDYVRFLSLVGGVELDFGVRSEFEQKAQATVIERYGRDTLGFVGGRDAAGNVQFPKSPVPVRPGAEGPEAYDDVRLADAPATLRSVTADRLNYTPDPPFWFGLAQFEGGARVLMELVDAPAKGFAVGDPLKMRFRIKSHDRRRGFRTYFWKAAPAKRPILED